MPISQIKNTPLFRIIEWLKKNGNKHCVDVYPDCYFLAEYTPDTELRIGFIDRGIKDPLFIFPIENDCIDKFHVHLTEGWEMALDLIGTDYFDKLFKKYMEGHNAIST